MKNSCLIATALITLANADLAYADPEPSVQIRKEYRGSEMPNHIMYAPLLLVVKELSAMNHDIALRLIRDKMQLDSTDAQEAMISEMAAALTELESDIAILEYETLCGPDAPRSKEALYDTFDRLDDLREIKYHNAYVKFVSELDAKQQQALNDWIAERKEGSYYRTASHKSMYERSPDLDVIGHVDMTCDIRRSKL
jgi:hypothetical protein